MLTGWMIPLAWNVSQCDGFPNEIAARASQRIRSRRAGRRRAPGRSGIRRTGGRPECGAFDAWEYEAAFGPRTAGVLYVFSPAARLSLVDVVRRAHAHYLPVLVDAAGELPPRANTALAGGHGGRSRRVQRWQGHSRGRRPAACCAGARSRGPVALQMLDMDDHAELWQPPADADRSMRGWPACRATASAADLGGLEGTNRGPAHASKCSPGGDYDADLAGHSAAD